MTTGSNTNNEQQALDVLMGIRLTSVEFVMDYIQLHFEEHTLSALTHPAVDVAGTWYHSGDCRYRDMLCAGLCPFELNA